MVANIGTICAEFAGIAVGFELFGISRYASVPAVATDTAAQITPRALPPQDDGGTGRTLTGATVTVPAGRHRIALTRKPD